MSSKKVLEEAYIAEQQAAVEQFGRAEELKDKLTVLRVSLYRIAQTIGIRDDMDVIEITRLAEKQDTGWNLLAAEIQQEVDILKRG